MKIDIKLDDRELKRAMRGFRREIPFTTALALTKTAVDARNHIVKTVYPMQVNAKNRGFISRGMRFEMAKKHNLTAAVFLDRTRISEAGYKAVQRLIDGTPHFPYNSRYLAVPVGPRVLTKTGRLSKHGRGLLDRENPRTFVRDLRGRGPAIWERMRNGRIRMAFVLKPKVPTPRKFSFRYSTIKRAERQWPKYMNEALNQVIAKEFGR